MEIGQDFYNTIADLCLKRFKTLPRSGKPKHDQWTVLSCIILEFNNCLDVVALGTGSKCIGKSKMCSSGEILNDSHAEVICRRSFLRFLYTQMKDVDVSSFLYFKKETKKYCFKENVRFHFFTTHMPCGDAAIFSKQSIDDFGCLIEKRLPKDREEAFSDYEVPSKKIKTEDIFRTGAKCLAEGEKQDLKLEGSAYHVLGAVRTKPGRGNPTLSVSCSDKLSKWCHLGIQGALLSLLLEKPIYLSTFTTVANTPFCKDALERALYNRLGNIKLPYPYLQNRMLIGESIQQFEFSKDFSKQPCPSSVSWCKVNEKSMEVAVEGKRQGVTKKHIMTPVGRLSICKLQLLKYFVEICELHKLEFTESCAINCMTYKNVKMLAVDYRNCWGTLRESFKIWTNKDEKLLEFSCK